MGHNVWHLSLSETYRNPPVFFFLFHSQAWGSGKGRCVYPDLFFHTTATNSTLSLGILLWLRIPPK